MYLKKKPMPDETDQLIKEYRNKIVEAFYDAGKEDIIDVMFSEIQEIIEKDKFIELMNRLIANINGFISWKSQLNEIFIQQNPDEK